MPSEPHDIIAATPFSTLRARCHYPEETNEETMDEIVSALHYVGVLRKENMAQLTALEKPNKKG